MDHRIEITFTGPAPADELARAKILASPEVTEAIENLSGALSVAGLAHEVSAKSVRTGKQKPRKAAPTLVAPTVAAAE